MYPEINWTEFQSECCSSCAVNVTELHAMNPICVHCSRVKFVKRDLYVERKAAKNDEKPF